MRQVHWRLFYRKLRVALPKGLPVVQVISMKSDTMILWMEDDLDWIRRCKDAFLLLCFIRTSLISLSSLTKMNVDKCPYLDKKWLWNFSFQLSSCGTLRSFKRSIVTILTMTRYSFSLENLEPHSSRQGFYGERARNSFPFSMRFAFASALMLLFSVIYTRIRGLTDNCNRS